MEIIVPKFDGFTMGKRNAFLRELSWGTYVKDYVEHEKAEYKKRALALAVERKNFVQNNKSEFRLDMSVDARTYMRWLLEDPYFWHDKNNVKRFKQDNPEVTPWK